MSGRLRTVVIGCGLAGRQIHLPLLRAMPEIELVGACDRDLERARATSAAFGIPYATDDAADLLREARPDLALVLTPPESHAELACAALAAGIHVVLEKPFVYEVAEADRVIEAAARGNARFTVIHNELFYPAVAELERRVAAGEFGALAAVHYVSANRNQRFVPEPWYFQTRGGRMGETLPHALCLLVRLLGPLDVEYARARRVGRMIGPSWLRAEQIGVDDLRVELAAQRDGIPASLWYSFNAETPTQILVCGEKRSALVLPFSGIFDLPPGLAAARLAIAHRLQPRLTRWRRRLRLSRSALPLGVLGHEAQLQAFVRHLSGEGPMPQAPEEAREGVRLWAEIVARAGL